MNHGVLIINCVAGLGVKVALVHVVGAVSTREWGGAVLLAIENAPPGKRAWYGMFPQLGAPIGFFFSARELASLGG